MKNIFVSHRYQGRWIAGALLPLLIGPAMAVDLATADGAWTFSQCRDSGEVYAFDASLIADEEDVTA